MRESRNGAEFVSKLRVLGCTYATESGVLDWNLIRRRLAAYRLAKNISVDDLATRVGVKPSTIYRIENVAENPRHQPKLQTIADWLQETEGPPLGEFFAAVAGELTRPDTTGSDNDHATSSVDSAGARDHGLGSVSSPDRLALEELRAFVLNLSRVLAAAARKDEESDRSNPGASGQAS